MIDREDNKEFAKKNLIFNEYNELDTDGLNLLRFDSDGLLIPKKVEYTIKKYFPVKSLKLIDEDKEIAIEKCLIILNDLSTTFYSDSKWKFLNSNILNEQTKRKNDNTYVYKNIIEALKKGTSKGSIIEVKENNGVESFKVGNYSKQYKLSDCYIKPKLVRYNIKTDYLIERIRAHFFSSLSTANENIIGKNLINIYGKLKLPYKVELLKIGKNLVKNKQRTKKGKILTLRNKHIDSYWVDSKNRSFIEDNIELFLHLTTNGFIIPNVGTENSGGRVVDSFTLMPSWIRDLILIDGEESEEVDFKCLHPNIAMNLYGGSSKYLNHQDLASYLNINLKKVKIEHLSFFNKEIYQMKKSVLFEYYNKNEKCMLDSIIRDKLKNGYKVTSYKMFNKETEIMTECIKRLNEIGIFVMYVYDALLCKKSEAEVVKNIMNEVILEKKVFTFVG